MNKLVLVIASLLIGVISAFAQAAFNTPGAGNPVIPGYFADPTIKKFGDTYCTPLPMAVVQASAPHKYGQARTSQTGP